MLSDDFASRFQSWKLAGETGKRGMPGKASCGGTWKTRTIRSGSSYGTGLRSTALTMLKMAVLAPMPSPSTATTARANEGVRRNTRQA